MTAHQIIAEVYSSRGIARDRIRSTSREPHLVAARDEAMGRIRHELGVTYPRIGQMFGRHHSTVIHSVRKWMAAAGFDVQGRHAQETDHQALVRQARFIHSQAKIIAEQARQLEGLAQQLTVMRTA